ncbi:MAG: hypothetical protein AAGC53_06160 [Actinomycetota bacterium]
MTDEHDTTPTTALERFLRRKGAETAGPERLFSDMVITAVLAAVGVLIGVAGEWWGWAAAAFFGLIAIVSGRQWRRAR